MKEINVLLRVSFFYFLSSVFFHVHAQKSDYTAPSMPVDAETKLISYSGVIDVKDTDKWTLYKRGEDWFGKYYKNASDVLRDRDSINFKLSGKHRFRVYSVDERSGVRKDEGLVQYTINVMMRDGRYKYEITEINWKQPSYYGIEKWVEKKEQYKAFNYYLFQTDSTIKTIVSNLDEGMKFIPPKSTKDNW